MKRVTYCITAVAAAFLALLFLNGAVRSTNASDPARPWYGYTRIVTITVATSSDPLTPALNSFWQLENRDQVVPNDVYQIPLPTDAYSINVQLLSGVYSIDPGPTVVITTDQPWFYLDYRTNQRALLVGNQILITQTASNNQQFRYLSTLNFTGPYLYVGSSGNSPISVTNSTVYWDSIPVIGTDLRHRFDTSTWLAHSALADKPDLEILTTTLQSVTPDRVQISAVIHNQGVTTTAAPPYLNLYDYLAPSTPPTSPLEVTNSWCSLYPSTQCAPNTTNPLLRLEPGANVTFTADYTLSPHSGTHDLYLFVDALGGSWGLNWESNENNNWKLVGSKFKSTVLLPLVRRN